MPAVTKDTGHLRAALRTKTGPAHERLDALLSTFDVRDAAGLSVFLKTQHAALVGLVPLAKDGRCGDMAVVLRDAAQQDLECLGVCPLVQVPALSFTPKPLAVEYVLAGSRLGTNVLRQRWRSSQESVVLAASAYFTAPDYMDAWRAFALEAREMHGRGSIAEAVIDDANRLFGHYTDCAEAAAAVS